MHAHRHLEYVLGWMNVIHTDAFKKRLAFAQFGLPVSVWTYTFISLNYSSDDAQAALAKKKNIKIAKTKRKA